MTLDGFNEIRQRVNGYNPATNCHLCINVYVRNRLMLILNE